MKSSLFEGILIGVFVLGAFIGLFVLSAFRGSTSPEAAVGSVIVWGTLPRDDVDNALNSLRVSTPALKGVSYTQKDPNMLATDLASAIATGSGPDLVLASQEELRSISKFIDPITPESLTSKTVASTFVQGASVYASQEGYLGLPFLVDPLVLFYNRSILATAGIPKPPESWEAVTGLVPKVTKLTASQQITRSLIALGTYRNVANARGILSTLFLQTGVPISGYNAGGGLSADLGVSANEGVPAGQSVLRFYTQFADPAKVSYTWNDALPDSEQHFLTGDLALYIAPASRASYLREANPNINIGVAPMPQPEVIKNRITYGRIYAFMFPRGAKNSGGAGQVASILGGNSPQEEFAKYTGLAPANLSALSKVQDDPAVGVAYEEALYTFGWLSPAGAATDSIFSDMIQSVISGRSSIDASLSKAERLMSSLLQ